MGQNKSTAVMNRRIEPPDSLDFFPTQPWGTRALCEEVLQPEIPDFAMGTVFDFACGKGDMVRPLSEYFELALGSDVFDYGQGYPVQDFRRGCAFDPPIDWVITNPPFNRGATAVTCGLRLATKGVAMLVRDSFLEGVGRYSELYEKHRPALVASFAERLPLVKGRLDPKASTATAYIWIVWTVEPAAACRHVWIPPCRKRLERPSDYALYEDYQAPERRDLFGEQSHGACR